MNTFLKFSLWTTKNVGRINLVLSILLWAAGTSLSLIIGDALGCGVLLKTYLTLVGISNIAHYAVKGCLFSSDELNDKFWEKTTRKGEEVVEIMNRISNWAEQRKRA